jgi:altronate hydrolase
MNSSQSFIQLHPDDHVAVALRLLSAGECLPFAGNEIILTENIPCGHKFALTPIAEGGTVLKFGEPIGYATCGIPRGAWIHAHNLRTTLGGAAEYVYQPAPRHLEPAMDGRTFDGYLRPDGSVGVRNEIWILPTVGCVNEIAEALAREASAGLTPGSGIDGVYAWKHPYGCSQLGDDHENTRRILADLAIHPNAGGILVIGLGCENNTMESFRQLLGNTDPERFRFMVTQQVGDEMAAGMSLLGELMESAGRCRRQPLPLASLRVGLKCGGSDGFSGITANPLVGAFSDLLVAAGGTTVLTEVPEMFGAENLFMNRCVDHDVFERCAGMVNGFKEYFLRHDQVVYENPSPGNKDGGISTLEEKSLGCTQKGGTSPVVDVLDYGATLRRPGLNLVAGPGNDIVAVTVLAAAGAQIILFTTGRGTPLGGPVPTLKIATNHDLVQRKPHWIDFDAGRLLDGETMADLAEALLDQIVEVASGRAKARNEENGFREIAIFKSGVTL